MRLILGNNKLNKSKYMTVKIGGSDFHERADELLKQNLYKEAASNYLNAILITRDDAKSYYGLGMCYKNTKNYSKAVKYLEKAVKLDEYNFEILYELGVCNLLQGVPCAAIKCFIRAIQINPDNPEVVLQLGIAHEACEEYDMALMVYQKLIENSPEFIKAYEHKSALLMKVGRFREASFVLNEQIKRNPADADAIAGIGICFDKLGKKSEAQRYYRKFLQTNPLSSQSQFIKTRLEKLKSAVSMRTDRFSVV